MKHIPLLLLPIVLGFSSPNQLRGGELRRYQLLGESGTSVPATIVWENISGLGKISGEIDYPGGLLGFHGTNPRSGYISFETENGIRAELTRQTVGGGFVWVGQFHFVDHSESIRLVPVDGTKGKPSAVPKTTSGKPAAGATVRNYLATDDSGGNAQITIHWTNISALGAISGQFKKNGQAVSFDGMNSESGYIWFRDTAGNYYEFRKGKSEGGKVRWSGSATTPSGQSESLWLTQQ